MKNSDQNKILQFIHSYSRPELFEEIPILVSKAFNIANEDSQLRINHCKLRRNRKRSQDRYFYVQEFMSEVKSGWNAQVLSSDNRGESYTQIETGNIIATIHVLPWFDSKVRRSKARDKNAEINEGLIEQLQLELNDRAELSNAKQTEKLNIIFVVVAPSPQENQSEAADISVLVPFADNNGYHLKINIDKLISGFSQSHPSIEPEDQAWPQLRRHMKEAEDADLKKQNE